MNSKEDLIKSLHQAANLMICDARVSRPYGTDHVLTYSDISLLKCIERNQNAKAGEISKYLGMTNGAVAQLSGKLLEKGYLEVYRLNDNKKEVYYRLTQKGTTACKAYDEHNAKLNLQLEDYLQTLNEDAIHAINGFFDTIIKGIETEKECYMKNAAEGEKPKEGKCEKCKRNY